MKESGLSRRKRTFHSGIRRKKLCQRICGDSATYHGGVEGKFRDGKIHDHEDCHKTNSEWYGKHNYKMSDKKRDFNATEKEREYKEGSENEGTV